VCSTSSFFPFGIWRGVWSLTHADVVGGIHGARCPIRFPLSHDVGRAYIILPPRPILVLPHVLLPPSLLSVSLAPSHAFPIVRSPSSRFSPAFRLYVLSSFPLPFHGVMRSTFRLLACRPCQCGLFTRSHLSLSARL
jgi:hypothetical protein